MLHLGSIALGERPCLLAAVRDGVPREVIEQAHASGVSAFELRVDLFTSQAPERVLAEAGRYAGAPLLCTIRQKAEGGAWDRSEQERGALYTALIPAVSAIDIETRALSAHGETVEAARAAGRLVIGSFHDFETTPELAYLTAMSETAKAQGADIFKAACYCRTADEVRLLARFMLDHTVLPSAVIAMGPAGLLSRVFFPALGSLLTYTFVGEATAPGQLTYQEMLRYLEVFYPECARSA